MLQTLTLLFLVLFLSAVRGKGHLFLSKTLLFIGQSNGEVRLAVDGLATGEYTSGRVQVYYKGQWSNICSSGFGKTEAHVICHQLGYDGANNFSTAGNDS